MRYTHLWNRLYGCPLLIVPEKAKIIEGVFRSHVMDSAPRAMAMDDDHQETPEQRAELEHAARAGMYAGIRLQHRPDKPYALTESGIALLPVHGTLVQRGSWMDAESGLTSYDRVASLLERSLADADVKAILFDIDSPGGEANGLMDLAGRVRAARGKKPTWAVANEQAYSAAYWLPTQASRLYVAETGGVGSIGAAMLHVDQSKRDEKMGYAYTVIYAGARKVDGNSHEAISKPALQWAQEEVDRMRDLFVAAVASGRGLAEDKVYATEAGLLRPREAVGAGFADGIATLRETVELLERTLPASQRTGSAASRPTRTRAEREREELQLLGITTAAAAPHAQADSVSQVSASAAQAAPSRATAAEAAQAAASSVRADRERLRGILGHQEARGRAQLAEHLAFETDVGMDQAIRMLAAAASAHTPGVRAPVSQPPAAEAATPDVTVRADRERVRAILRHKEATGRTQFAEHLAYETDISPEEAIRMLAAAAKGGGWFPDAMAKLQNPKVGVEFGDVHHQIHNFSNTTAAAIYERRRAAVAGAVPAVHPAKDDLVSGLQIFGGGDSYR